MIENIRGTVNKIDSIIRKGRLWFDFCVFHFDGYRLTIAGSTETNYYHELEVIFENVFFVKAYFTKWNSDTSQPVFILPDKDLELSLNLEYEIEHGYTLFIFKTEDYKNDVVIAAEKISFNTDTVLYHFRDELKVNERLADFVKRPS